MPVFKRRMRFHSIRRPKLRADMKRETLYNISQARPQYTNGRTYFQQKWAAKSMMRAYHGELMREQQWQRLFKRTAPAVVPMDPRYLAQNDGHEFARGRGSGLSSEGGAQRTPQPIPYMQMTFHPAERRLDYVVYRSLFASSARQARQFVVHGHVKVNGKMMRYPGYTMNPGDMFQVDPDMVMYGLGVQKASSGSSHPVGARGAISRRKILRRLGLLAPKKRPQRLGKKLQARLAETGSIYKDPRSKPSTLAPSAQQPTSEEAKPQKEGEEEEEEDPDATILESLTLEESELNSLEQEWSATPSQTRNPPTPTDPNLPPSIPSTPDSVEATRTALKNLWLSTRDMLRDAKAMKALSGKKKQAMRSFSQDLRRSMSKAASVSPEELQSLAAAFKTHSDAVTAARFPGKDLDPQSNQSQPPSKPEPTIHRNEHGAIIHSPFYDPSNPHDLSKLPPEKRKILEDYDANPAAPGKPYASPWQAREYLSPFAFIPRYLEVNQRICSGVYLRHPVAGPGYAEVPSPFGPVTGALAFNWYLRRR